MVKQPFLIIRGECATKIQSNLEIFLVLVLHYSSGLGRFDNFHFQIDFGRFWPTKNRGGFDQKNLGFSFPRFGFSTLTTTFTLSLQLPDISGVSPDALWQWPAFTSHQVVQNDLARDISIMQVASPTMHKFLHTHSPPGLHVVLSYQMMTWQDQNATMRLVVNSLWACT